MGKQFVRASVIIFLAEAIIWPCTLALASTALDDYVAAPDPSYSYSLIYTVADSNWGYTGYIIDVNSQSWRNADEVDRTVWKHWLTVVVPGAVSEDTALLLVDGGNNGGAPPDQVDLRLALVASLTNTVVARLEMVPNQPLYFADESRPRSEDAIIAYSWKKFVTTGDQTWPVQLPMVKSVVRAMDTIQTFCNSLDGGKISINNFVVGGGSKRGWTTWLTAAVDSRVRAIIPLVFDAPDLEESFRHHYAAYGYWAPAVSDYEEMGVFDWINTADMEALMEIVDPYVYFSRFTMPKYIINSTGDEFFLPDSSQFYFEDLPNKKYLRYVPNTSHSLEQAALDVIDSVAGFYKAVLSEMQLPEFSWTLENDGSIHVQTLDTPKEVRLWQASNSTTRDFRLETIGAAWTSSVLSDQGGGVYIGKVPQPETGWTAFFVELIYDSGEGFDFKFSTFVNVVPDYLPFVADFNFDGEINLGDLGYFASQWLQTEPSLADIAPKGRDGTVNLLDFALLGENWLGKATP